MNKQTITIIINDNEKLASEIVNRQSEGGLVTLDSGRFPGLPDYVQKRALAHAEAAALEAIAAWHRCNAP